MRVNPHDILTTIRDHLGDLLSGGTLLTVLSVGARWLFGRKSAAATDKLVEAQTAEAKADADYSLVRTVGELKSLYTSLYAHSTRQDARITELESRVAQLTGQNNEQAAQILDFGALTEAVNLRPDEIKMPIFADAKRIRGEKK